MSEQHCEMADCWRKDTTYVPELEMWLCTAHGGPDEVVIDLPEPKAITSADVERAATLAWNEAIEQAAKAMDAMRVSADAEVARSTAEAHSAYWKGQSFGLTKAAVSARAMKRPA